MKLDSFQATDAKRGEAVVILQVTESTLNRHALPIEVTEALRVAKDAREHSTTKANRQDRLPSLLHRGAGCRALPNPQPLVGVGRCRFLARRKRLRPQGEAAR